jgi:hypothetical protein
MDIAIEWLRLAGIARRRFIKSPVCDGSKAQIDAKTSLSVADSLTGLRMYESLPAFVLPCEPNPFPLSTEKWPRTSRISPLPGVYRAVCASTVRAIGVLQFVHTKRRRWRRRSLLFSAGARRLPAIPSGSPLRVPAEKRSRAHSR